MTIFEKTNSLKASSLRSRKKPRVPGPANYDPPVVESPVLLGPTDDDPGNQVHTQDQGLAVSLKFPNLPAGGNPDRTRVQVQAKWDGDLVGDPVVDTTPLPPNWADDKRLVIPPGKTDEPGPHVVRYRVTFGLNGKDSDPITIHVDQEAPTLSEAVTYPDEIKNDGFTHEYFEDVSPHALLSYKDTYTGAKTGDLFEFWIGKIGADGKPTADSTLIETVELVSPRQALETKKLTRALIKVDEGEIDLFAYVTDRKGNRSLASPAVTVPILMIPMPKDLKLDIVLESGDVTDRVILFRDAQVPVHGKHQFLNWRPGDKLRRKIANQAEKVLDIMSSPPFVDDISYRELLDDGNLDLKNLEYKYQIQRGNKLIPATPITKILKVHLDKPGVQPEDPDNPGLPGSPDPKLNIVNVKGVNPRPNYLNEQDKILGAKIRVPIYEGHKKDDEIEFHYQGVPLPTVLKLDGNEADDEVLEADIPPDYVADGGNNKNMRVGYTVYHRDVNDTIAVAVDQHVDVYVDEILMPQPKFEITADPGNGDGQSVYCDSLVRDPDTNNVVVEVVFAANAKFADKKISFFIQGYENVTDSGSNKPGNTIDGAFSSVEKTPTVAEAAAGFSVYFEHTVFQTIFSGWCELSCASIQDGYYTRSLPLLHRVSMNHGDHEYCDLPPPLTK
ncbi:hypothetical protein J3D47_004721 [Pseudomonas laurylsulfativorans]|uniref:hypothetical protein n=1 Tax=Pseudomonas laurylsulfativorans TaxID=1943631 RepID=UPI0020A22729|nr:hypothetical protein [Pseudomonas laurylsulfativorans]MCP1420478.1 hypothetical protein [Pseudomonas laurylsulfativorans]